MADLLDIKVEVTETSQLKTTPGSSSGTVIMLCDSIEIPRIIGPYRIATVLREHGVKVHVFDFLSRWNPEELLDCIRSIGDISWIGISTKWRVGTDADMTTLDVSIMKESTFIEELRSIAPVIAGGPASEVYSNMVPDGYIDYFVHASADLGIMDLHDHIKGKIDISERFTDKSGIKNLDCSKLYSDIDLSNITTTFTDSDFITGGEPLPMETGRGCIFHCAFCEFRLLGKKAGTYGRPEGSLKEDIREKHEKYGTTDFSFSDDTFNDSVDKMEKFLRIRDELNIPFTFWAYCRIDLLMAYPRMMELMPLIGWNRATFGLESLYRPSGKAIGKGADPEKMKPFILELQKFHPALSSQWNLIFGLPHSTKETCVSSYQWLADNKKPEDVVVIHELKIRSSDSISYASKISRDPAKYGYEIDGRVSKSFSYLLNWKTDTMSQKEAKALARVYRKKAQAVNPPSSRLWDMDMDMYTLEYIEKKRNYILGLKNK